MTQFQKAMQSPVKCDICGEIMHPIYGGGWDNDRIVCAAIECGAEIVYPTSTEMQNAPDDLKRLVRLSYDAQIDKGADEVEMNIINKKFDREGMPNPDGGRAERYSRSDDRKYREAVYWREPCARCGKKVCVCERTGKEALNG